MDVVYQQVVFSDSVFADGDDFRMRPRLGIAERLDVQGRAAFAVGERLDRVGRGSESGRAADRTFVGGLDVGKEDRASALDAGGGLLRLTPTWA